MLAKPIYQPVTYKIYLEIKLFHALITNFLLLCMPDDTRSVPKKMPSYIRTIKFFKASNIDELTWLLQL